MKSNTTWRVNDETRRRDFLVFVAHAPARRVEFNCCFFFRGGKTRISRLVSSFFLRRIFRIFEERRSARIRIAEGRFRGTHADDDETVRKRLR